MVGSVLCAVLCLAQSARSAGGMKVTLRNARGQMVERCAAGELYTLDIMAPVEEIKGAWPVVPGVSESEIIGRSVQRYATTINGVSSVEFHMNYTIKFTHEGQRIIGPVQCIDAEGHRWEYPRFSVDVLPSVSRESRQHDGAHVSIRAEWDVDDAAAIRGHGIRADMMVWSDHDAITIEGIRGGEELARAGWTAHGEPVVGVTTRDGVSRAYWRQPGTLKVLRDGDNMLPAVHIVYRDEHAMNSWFFAPFSMFRQHAVELPGYTVHATTLAPEERGIGIAEDLSVVWEPEMLVLDVGTAKTVTRTVSGVYDPDALMIPEIIDPSNCVRIYPTNSTSVRDVDGVRTTTRTTFAVQGLCVGEVALGRNELRYYNVRTKQTYACHSSGILIAVKDGADRALATNADLASKQQTDGTSSSTVAPEERTQEPTSVPPQDGSSMVHTSQTTALDEMSLGMWIALLIALALPPLCFICVQIGQVAFVQCLFGAMRRRWVALQWQRKVESALSRQDSYEKIASMVVQGWYEILDDIPGETIRERLKTWAQRYGSIDEARELDSLCDTLESSLYGRELGDTTLHASSRLIHWFSRLTARG